MSPAQHPEDQEETAVLRENTTEIQKTEKSEVASLPEQTWSGPLYSPSVDIFETDDAITILADMPGVKADDLRIDLREGTLTLLGPVTRPERSDESMVAREYDTGTFFRRFALSDTIDQAKIDAKLSDGVLRLELPKTERARPRKISVRTQ